MENKVELLGYYGSDEVHAQSAWTSTSRDLTDDKIQRIPALLKMLAEQGHHTPFEKSSLHFLVTVDQATHIHLLKHRIGVSINGESARYKELKEDKCYLPEDWKNSYPSVSFLNRGDLTIHLHQEQSWFEILQIHNHKSNLLYHQCLEDLTPILGRKRAKESARFFKTMNSQITMDVMFNWRSFFHFLSLRNKPDSQKEVREVAQKMLDAVKQIPDNPFKYTIDAFGI